VLLGPVAEVSPVRSASLKTRQRVGRGAFGSRRPGGRPPSRRSGLSRPETPGYLRGYLGRDQVENLRRAGGPETDPLTASFSKTRRHRRRNVFSETRRSRSAGGKAGGSAGDGDAARALERWNPKRASACQRGGSPAGYGLTGRINTLQLRRTVFFQKTSEWRNAVSRNGKRVMTPKGARLPGRSKALKGKPHERHRPEKGRKPAGGANRRGRVKRRGRN
jgi:hypothetical protein